MTARDKAAERRAAAQQKDLEDARDWVFSRISALKKENFEVDENDPNVGYLVTTAGNVVRVTVGPVENGDSG